MISSELYEVKQRAFKTMNNKHAAVFGLREETSDFNTINSAFHHDEYELLTFPFKEGDVFIDIGAHIGGVSILAATAFPKMKVLAFEPIKENYDLLVKNIKENDLSGRVSAFHFAVAKESNKKLKIYMGNMRTEDGRHHRFIGVEGGRGDYQEANTISLDEIMKDISECRYLKVDCEGGEYAIFDGASKETLKRIGYIFGEFHAIPNVSYGFGVRSLLELTKGVFKSITPEEEYDKMPGHFIFTNENSS